MSRVPLVRAVVCCAGIGLATAVCTSSTLDNQNAQSVAAIAISPTTFIVVLSATQQFTAAAYSAEGDSLAATVDWGASGGIITSTGLFTAGGVPGVARVWATSGSVADTVQGSIAAQAVASVTVSPTTLAVATGATQQFTAAAFAAGGAPLGVTFVWGASGGSVSSSGLFTAGGATGPARVWAKAGGVADTVSGTVSAPVVATVTVTPNTFNVVTGATKQFTAAAFATGGTPMSATFAWGATGGTISSTGFYTAGGTPGTSKVWATAGGITDTVTGTVAAPVVATVTVAPSSFSVITGATKQFTAAAFAAGGAPLAATFTWGATGGTVSGSGLFTAGGTTGTAKVWATTAGIADTAVGTVTPAAINTVTVTPNTFSVVTAATKQFTAAAFAAGGAPVATTFTWGATGGTVSASGLFTAGGATGAAKVWATAAGISDTATGTITPVITTVDTVFAEGFESGSFAVWDDRGGTGNQAIVTSNPHGGTRALQVTFPSGSDGGWLTKFFLPGYDSLYASFWVRFQSGWQSGTKLLDFYGSRTDNQWSATGKAGVCPNGTDFFSLAVVQERSGNPGPTHFYSYYPGMGQSPPGSGTCYGLDGISSGAIYTAPLEILPTAWHHVEYWVVINTPGQNNGYQRFCVDGVVRGVWSGINVRSSTILRLNAVTITNSIANGSPQTQMSWVDDLLVTRQRPAGAC